MNGEFVLCDAYRVKKNDSNEKPKRLFAIFSFNKYGDQGKDKVTFHILKDNQIDTISGANARLLPLRWFDKDVNKAAIFGGLIGTILSLIIQNVLPLIWNIITN